MSGPGPRGRLGAMNDDRLAMYWLHVGMFLGSATSYADVAAMRPWQTEAGGVREMWHRLSLDIGGRPTLAVMLSRWLPDAEDAKDAMRELAEVCRGEKAARGLLLDYGTHDDRREYGLRLDPQVLTIQPGGSEAWFSLARDAWTDCPSCGRPRLHQMVSHLDAEGCFSDHDEAVCNGCRSVLLCCMCGQGDPVELAVGAEHPCPCGKTYRNQGDSIKVAFPAAHPS